MNNWIKWLGISLFTTMGMVSCSYGQAVPDTLREVVEVWDSTEVTTNSVNEDYDSEVTTTDETYPEWDMENEMPLISDTLEVLRKKKEFGYMQDLDSLLRGIKIEQETLPTAKPKKQSKPFIPPYIIAYLLWGLAIGAVLFILYQLFAGQGRLFAPGNKKKKPDQALETVKSDEIVYAPIQLAMQAAQAGNYRLAVRYQYLHLLQAMAAKKIIELLPQRTNQQYLRAITKTDCKKEFATVLLQYEYVWFGNLNITEAQYRSIEAGYRNFMNKWLST